MCEIESKRPCFIRIGEFVNVWGFMKVPLLAFMQLVGYNAGDELCLDLIRCGTANTAVINHQKKTYCLAESDLPFKI